MFNWVVLMLSCSPCQYPFAVFMSKLCSTPWGAMEVDPSQALEAQRKVRCLFGMPCSVDVEIVHDYIGLLQACANPYEIDVIAIVCHSTYRILETWSNKYLYTVFPIIDTDENIMALQTTSSTTRTSTSRTNQGWLSSAGDVVGRAMR